MSDVKSEIAALVTKKVGIPKDKALQAVDVILNYLKQNMPPAAAGQLDAILTGNLDLSDGVDLDEAAGMLVGLLGVTKKK
jgi:hypothetical protein